MVFGAGAGVVSFFGFLVRWAVSPRSEVTEIVAVLIFCALYATWIAFAALIMGVPVVGLQTLASASAPGLPHTAVVALATGVGVAVCLLLAALGMWAINESASSAGPIDVVGLLPVALILSVPICFSTSVLIGRAHVAR
ncbi:hypothetical protein GCM10009710_03690 [Aeromicrobium alkaliterrae]|uniref:Uncharacterized protein n=1 Tax=Aeromicrobium alkaliterrae TaxID=302168 RepID=A0ABP4VGL2_9ACTN